MIKEVSRYPRQDMDGRNIALPICDAGRAGTQNIECQSLSEESLVNLVLLHCIGFRVACLLLLQIGRSTLRRPRELLLASYEAFHMAKASVRGPFSRKATSSLAKRE